MQSNWEAVKTLALDTTTAVQQQPTSPSHDAQSTAQVSCFPSCICFPGACTAVGEGMSWGCVGRGMPQGVIPGGMFHWGAASGLLTAHQQEYAAACSTTQHAALIMAVPCVILIFAVNAWLIV